MNKHIKRAIEEGFPMWWEFRPGFGEMALVARTYLWENGSMRTRMVFRTYERENAHEVARQVLAAGGTDTIRQLEQVLESHDDYLAEREVEQRKWYPGRFQRR